MMSLLGNKERILAGTDIGSSKISTVLGLLNHSGTIDIIGVGTSPNPGVRKGTIIDIESTTSAISKSLQEAQMMAGCNITNVTTNVTGRYIQCENIRESIRLRKQKVTPQDMQLALQRVMTLPLPTERELFQIDLQQFVIDGEHHTQRPLGMNGEVLEICAHVLSSSRPSLANMDECFQHALLQCDAKVFSAIASLEACCTQDEKELGVVVIDIGAGTTDVCLMESNRILYSMAFPIGGNHITNDISLGLRVRFDEAELVKVKYGHALSKLVKNDDFIHIQLEGQAIPKEMPKQAISDIIEPRLEELFRLIWEELCLLGLDRFLTTGVVLTGGTSKLQGISELAEEVMGVPIRRGSPIGFGGLLDVVSSPVFSTSIGLLMYQLKAEQKQLVFQGKQNSFAEKLRRFQNWFKEFF